MINHKIFEFLIPTIENNIYFQNIYKFLATPAHGAKKFRGGHSLVRGGHGHPGPPPNGATAVGWGRAGSLF